MDDATPPAAQKTLAEQEAEYEKFIWKNLPRNYAGHFIHGMLGMTGFRLLNAPTFLPAYLFALSGSNALVGIALSVQQAGNCISPLIGAAQAEHRKRLMPVAQVIGLGMRAPILLIALAGWFLPTHIQLPIIIALLFVQGLFGGMQRVVFQTLLAKVIPVGRRGRLQAWRNVVGGIIAAALAYFAGRWLIETNVLGNGYATTFLLAFVLTSLGLTALSLLMREPEPPTIRAKAKMGDRMKDLPALLRGDRSFFYFMLSIVCAMGGRAAAPFYILYASQTIELSGANIGLLSLAFLGADTVSNLIWGYAGDRFGFRSIFITSLVAWAAATVLLLNSHEILPIFIAFMGLGAGQAGYMMASQTMALEFGQRDDVAMRLALTGTAEGVMMTAGPVIGGLL
ncbi:MAG: MFS transporter, partial [Caulobacterales bacterium]